MSHEADRFVPNRDEAGTDARSSSAQTTVSKGHLLLIEGKCFWQFQDIWSDPPRYFLPLEKLADKSGILHRATLFQLAVRAIASSTNERTAVGAIIPPAVVFGHSCFIDSTPGSYSRRLEIVAVLNSFPFDWIIRQFVGSNVSLFIVRLCPYPKKLSKALLAHSALRLTCNHTGYAPLWKEQLGDAWREPGKAPLTWPVLADDDARWAVRAAIDAVVADAYGLSRQQYAHVLSTFSHASYRSAPGLCLERFDELKRIGLDAFTRKHDPYWDIPLNESLPQPVIDLPVAAVGGGGLFGEQEVRSRKRSG